MRTSEDSPRSGLYASECCGAQLVFYKRDTFWRCPICHNLCEWELLKDALSPGENALSPGELDSLKAARPVLASAR